MENFKRWLQDTLPEIPVFSGEYLPAGIWHSRQGKTCTLAEAKEIPVFAFAGIGSPDSFRRSLTDLGAAIVDFRVFADHHPYTLQDLRSIENLRGQDPIVTTLKDLPRLPAQWREVLSGEVLALAIKMEITSGLKDWETALFGDHVRHRPA